MLSVKHMNHRSQTRYGIVDATLSGENWCQLCGGAKLEKPCLLPTGSGDRRFEQVRGARQITSFRSNLAAKANTFCQKACFVRIENEHIDVIKDSRCVLDATGRQEKITK